MFLVRVGGNDKRIFALGEAHGQFIAHLVGFLGGNLAGLERLPNLIGDHIIFLPASCDKFVLSLGQHIISGNPQHLAFGGTGVHKQVHDLVDGVLIVRAGPEQQVHHPGKAAVLPVCRIHPAVLPLL